MYKLFVTKFISWLLSLLMIALTFNIIIDPYNVTNYNMLNIEHKFIRDNRLFKINQIKELEQIDNLILGSSRSEGLNPKLLDEYLGGFTYSFSIGGANIEDHLGILLYLEKIDKIPKNILLCLDFGAFSKDLPTPSGFYKIPELNFLNTNSSNDALYKLLSIDAIRASFKTLKNHIKSKQPDSYIDEQGFLVRTTKDISNNLMEINKLTEQYYNFTYKKGKMVLSEKRFEYLKQIVEISNRYHISLKIMLTPVHTRLFNKIIDDDQLVRTFINFKSTLHDIHEFYDFMIDDDFNTNDSNFEDAVHYTEEYGNLLIRKIYGV